MNNAIEYEELAFGSALWGLIARRSPANAAYAHRCNYRPISGFTRPSGNAYSTLIRNDRRAARAPASGAGEGFYAAFALS